MEDNCIFQNKTILWGSGIILHFLLISFLHLAYYLVQTILVFAGSRGSPEHEECKLSEGVPEAERPGRRQLLPPMASWERAEGGPGEEGPG